MSARREQALATLARLGIDPAEVTGDTPPADWLAIRLAGPDGTALAHALAELGTAATAARLARLEPALASVPARKAVRRTLFRLGQRGIAVPAATTAPAPRPLGDADIEGFVSGVDGHGDRIVWLVKAQAGGGTLVVAAELNEPDGLRAVRLLETTRKQLRETRARLEREAGLGLVPADWRALDALLLEGQDRARAPERSRDWRRLRGRITTDPPAAAAELRSARVAPPGDAEVAGLASAAPALLDDPEFRSWWPAPEALQPFLDELTALRESPLVLAPAQQEERVRAVLERAAAVLFPPAVTARRLEATAFVLAESGRVAAARQALATARLLRERAGLGGDVPLVTALVQQAIGARYAAAQAEREVSRRGSLVMTPGEVLTARSPSRPTRAPG